MSHHKSVARQDRPEKTEKLLRERSIRTNRRNKFVECLSSQDVNIGMRNMGQVSIFISDPLLRRTTKIGMGRYSWRPPPNGLATFACEYNHSGSCDASLNTTYQGYLPLPTLLRSITLTRKRGEYQDMVDLAFTRGREGLDQQIWHQIEIDVPRTRPGVRLWMHAGTQRVRAMSFEPGCSSF